MKSDHIAAVAFDLDGTLVDLERFHHEAWLRAARSVGVELTWEQALRRLPNFIGGPDARVAAQIVALAPAGASPERTLTAKERWFSALVGAVEEIVPRAGVAEVVDRLRGRGVPVAVATSTERGTALAILHRTGLLPVFGAARVVTAQDVTRPKPAPDAYRITAWRLGVPPSRQLVFEDSVVGMSAARAAGSPFVAVPTVADPGYLASVTAAGAVGVFRSWHEPDLSSLLDRLLSAETTVGTAPGATGVRP
ncbi:HAD family phosphatase [Catenulispora subtropica]|uniref:HAD family phosphatase n=1 Tax=Catenulispora subtropica TaxID=450798 RepID=A0ABN2RNU6_9ACTN